MTAMGSLITLKNLQRGQGEYDLTFKVLYFNSLKCQEMCITRLEEMYEIFLSMMYS